MSQSGSSEPAVCSKRESALVIWRYTFSSRSAQALLDFRLFRFSRKKYSSRNFVISGIAGRQISSRIRQREDIPVRTILVDICCPISGSDSTSCHLSRQTVVPHVLSPVFVLTFSVHLGTSDTVRRNHRMSLDLRPRLSICLSISTLLLSQAPLPMQIPQGILQMSVYLTV